MSRNLYRVCVLCTLVTMAGCQKKAEQNDTEAAAIPAAKQDLIAVIDLNLVAEEIGAQAKIDRSLKEKEQELLKKFNGLKAELGRKVADLQKPSQDLNDQRQNQLDAMTAQNQDMLTLQAQAAQSQLLAYHTQLKQKLLSQIRPVAYQVVQEKGMQIVLTVGQVYAAGPNVDITQDVVKRIQTINQSASKGPAPGEPVTQVASLPGGGEFMPR